MLILISFLPAVALAGTSGPSPVPAPPSFQVSTSTLTLCRGVVNNVPLRVYNPGSQPMTSLQLGIVASRNIYTIGNGTVNQATVPAGNTIIANLPIFVSLNTSELVSVGISVNYNYLTLYSDSEIRNVSFGVETCPSPLNVQTGSVVTSGKIENLTLNLTNTGNITLGAVSVQISLPPQDAAILTQQPTHVGTLTPGRSAQVTNRVFIYRNASQSFPLNVSVMLYNGTSPVQILDTVPLLSVGIINITPSSITLSPQAPTVGGIFSVSLILTDIGTVGASAVSVTPLPPQGITAYGSPSVFVGDLAVDTQVPVTLTLQSGGSLKAGAYTIPVRINYRNNLRENISTIINVPITLGYGFSSNSTGARSGSGSVMVKTGSSLLTLLTIIIIVALAIVAYVKRKALVRYVEKATHRSK